MDAVLPMGCSSSCAIFEAFSDALHWIVVSTKRIGCCSFSGRFFCFSLLPRISVWPTCKRSWLFVPTLAFLLHPARRSHQRQPYLGITLDSVRLEARLPVDKLEQCKLLLRDFSARSKVSLRELQSLIGVLNFACSVVVPGRPFLRRLIELTIGVVKPHHHIRLTQQVKMDLAIWLELFSSFNGRSFFLRELTVSSDSLQLYTDAARTYSLFNFAILNTALSKALRHFV